MEPEKKPRSPTPEPKRGPFWRPKATAAVLNRDGTATTYPAHGDAIEDRDGGRRVLEAGARFWLDRPIPAGWLTVYVSNDPEPITHRDPAGYDARTVGMLAGNYALHLVGGGLKKNHAFRLSAPILIGALVFVFVLGAAYYVYRRRYA